MTKQAALQRFFSSFGLEAYPNGSTPPETPFPWLEYDATLAEFGESTSIEVGLWFYTDSEAIPNAKAEEVRQAIGYGGKLLPCDGGAIWVKRGSPWCRPLTDETNRAIKRRLLNVDLEFLSL